MQILLGSPRFLTLHICWVKCEHPSSFYTTPIHGRMAPLKYDDSVLPHLPSYRDQDTMSPPEWWPHPFQFNTTHRFRYGVSLRGLHPNDVLLDFISIRVIEFFLMLAFQAYHNPLPLPKLVIDCVETTYVKFSEAQVFFNKSLGN